MKIKIDNRNKQDSEFMKNLTIYSFDHFNYLFYYLKLKAKNK